MNQRAALTKISTIPRFILGMILFACSDAALAIAPTEVSGELDVIIKEDFEHNRFENDYFIRNADGTDWYQLQFDRLPPGHLKSGQRITVRGQPKGRKFQVESLEEEGSSQPTQENTGIVTDTAALPDAQAIDQRNAVVLMVNLTNASSGYTKDQIIGHMYTNTRSVDGLYREASLGQLGFAAESAAQAAGIDLSQYRHRIFVLPKSSSLPNCSWAGIANVGCGTFCRAWMQDRPA
jgi:hypothetical protein